VPLNIYLSMMTWTGELWDDLVEPADVRAGLTAMIDSSRFGGTRYICLMRKDGKKWEPWDTNHEFENITPPAPP
jgi:hypothetical protein